jgi:hypothetical protein
MIRMSVKSGLLRYLFVYAIFMAIGYFSCHSNEQTESNYKIPIAFYKKGFPKKSTYTMSIRYKRINGKKFFHYKCEKLQPGLKVLEVDNLGKLFYDNQRLQLVDSAELFVDDSLITVNKYINSGTNETNNLSYFYLNESRGLILVENLVHNNIVEYDTDIFRELHKKIVTGTFLFKESDYVLQLRKELTKLNENITK